MAIALIPSSGVGAKNTNTGATTSSVNTTGANLIVIGVTAYSTYADVTVGDSASNTWTALGWSVNSSIAVQLYYCFNPTTSSTHTFTVGTSSAAVYPSIFAAAFSGVPTFSPGLKNTGTASSGMTVQPGSVTPGVSGSLIVTVAGDRNGTAETWTINDSFTIAAQEPGVSGSNLGGGMAYLIQSTAAAVNPTWTCSGSDQPYAAAIFSPAAASSPAGFLGLL